MKFYNKLSVQKKLIIYILSIVIFIGGVVGLLIRSVIFPYLIREMTARGTTMAHRLAENSRKFILTRDKIHLTSSLFDEKRLEKNVAYIIVIVTDESDKILAHTLIDIQPSISSGLGFVGKSWARSRKIFEKKYLPDYVPDIEVLVYDGIYQDSARIFL